MTSAVALSAPSTTRSVPRTTVMPALAAAPATMDHARSRNAGSGGGTAFPTRYPGMKHSGKQTTCAPFADASSIARRARAMRTGFMRLSVPRAALLVEDHATFAFGTDEPLAPAGIAQPERPASDRT